MALPAHNEETAIVTPTTLFANIMDMLEMMESTTTDDDDRAMIAKTAQQAKFLYHGMRAGTEKMKEQRDEAVAELDGMFEALDEAENNDWYAQIKAFVETRVLSDIIPGMMKAHGMSRTECEKHLRDWTQWK